MHEELINKTSRTNLINQIANQLKSTNYKLPVESYRALDFLLLNLASNKNQRLALVKGSCDLEFHQYSPNTCTNIFMKKKLKIHPKNTLTSKVNLQLKSNKITLSYLDNQQPTTETIPIEGFLTVVSQDPEIYKHFEGIAIRKQCRRLYHNKKLTVVGSYTNRYVIVIFDKDKEYFFDLKGKQLFEAPGIRELNKNKNKEHYRKVKEKAEELTLDNLVYQVRNELISRWKQDKKSFQGQGRTKLIQGKVQTKTTPKGYLPIKHYEREDNTETQKFLIFLSEFLPSTDTTVNFKGPYLWIEDSDSQPIRGFTINNSALEYSRLRDKNFEDYHFITLKERNNIDFFNNQTQLRAGNHVHTVLLSEYERIKEQVGDLEQFDRRAIYISSLEDVFTTELWLMKDKEFLSLPIQTSKVEL